MNQAKTIVRPVVLRGLHTSKLDNVSLPVQGGYTPVNLAMCPCLYKKFMQPAGACVIDLIGAE